MHYYQFNIGDYMSHTKGLTLLEDLAYRRMLDEYYLHESPLPLSISEIARQIGLPEKKEEVGYVLSKFFVETDKGYINARAQKEIKKYKANQRKKSEAGKLSGKARRNKNIGVEQTLNTCLTNDELNINHKPLTINQEPVNSKKPIRSKAGILLSDYLNECKAKAEKPISSDDPLFTYCEQAGIPDDYTALAWRVFKDSHLTKNKRYVDWKAAFRNAVKQDWYKLWAIDREGNFYLTTAGKQAESAHFGDKK